jgi:hypothetical protein
MGSSKRLVDQTNTSATMSSPTKKLRPTATTTTGGMDEEQEQELRKQVKIAQEQQRIREEFEKDDDRLVNPSENVIDTVMTRINDTFNGVTTIRAAGKDAHLLRLVSEKIAAQVSNIGASQQRLNGTLLSAKLIDAFSTTDRVIDFAQLGEQIQVFFRAIPTYDCMLGPVEIRLAPKKERAKREKKATEHHPVEKLKELAPANGGGEAGANGETAAESGADNLFKMHNELQKELARKLMEKGQPDDHLSVFEAVVDPKSFTQTVENVFALTFLVKVSLAWLKVDPEEQVPTVIGVASNTRSETQSTQTASATPPKRSVDSQFIAAISYEDWERIRDEYEIQQGLMQHRVSNIYDDAKQEDQDEEEE